MRAADTPSERFPWEQAMALGLGVLRLSPQIFWALTPREFAACLGPADATTARPARGDLERLMHEFPDNGEALG